MAPDPLASAAVAYGASALNLKSTWQKFVAGIWQVIDGIRAELE
jgi:hypothetical protein